MWLFDLIDFIIALIVAWRLFLGLVAGIFGYVVLQDCLGDHPWISFVSIPVGIVLAGSGLAWQIVHEKRNDR